MIKVHNGQHPTIDNTCFVAETASVMGNVVLKPNASIWYGVVARGDYNDIYIGEGSNIQDGSVLHIAYHHPTIIGDFVTVGHNAIVHGCTVGDRVLVGMGAVILNGAVIGNDTIIAAGSLVPEGKTIPAGVLAMGSPAKVIRDLTSDEIDRIKRSAEDYIVFAQQHKREQDAR
ncbi:gamma carbonic anhydrase family protein [Anoxynatronum sibiricum]|uniref:Gamma carbonic anhydrase family protein n=1 Tax=Anoxynatronum sibiricum TaxID=210623 RepID=A0ABU9VPZ2_9CLOT